MSDVERTRYKFLATLDLTDEMLCGPALQFAVLDIPAGRKRPAEYCSVIRG